MQTKKMSSIETLWFILYSCIYCKRVFGEKHIEVIRDKGTILAMEYLNKRYDNEVEEEKG